MKRGRSWIDFIAPLFLSLVVQSPASAQYQQIYAFPVYDGPSGAVPYEYVIPDAAGNVFGTTTLGGQGPTDGCCGVVFQVDSAGDETVLFNFAPGVGANPWAGLIQDAAGNFYGTAIDGDLSFGVVFKLDPAGHQTVLHAFSGRSDDGAYPAAALVRDTGGSLYGTTMGCYPLNRCGDKYGKVFKVDHAGNFTVLHTFTAQGTYGQSPWTGLVEDGAGNLYGATIGGGAFRVGTIFKLDAAGSFKTLYSFSGRADGKVPQLGSLIRDAAGNLYVWHGCGGGQGLGTCVSVGPR